MEKRGLNKTSVIAFTLIGICALTGISLYAPEQLSHFVNIPGLLLVIGGTLVAILMCRPIQDVKRVLKSVPTLLKNNETSSTYSEINQLLSIADYYRHGFLRNAEEELSYVNNDFLRAGMQQVLDGASLDEVNKMLHWHKEGIKNRELADAQILKLMGSFAPAFGMLGTLLGLILMLHSLNDTNIATLGSTIGFAMITTLYGIIISNLFLKPLAIKKQQRVEQYISQLTMLQEGIIMLHQRQHPMLIKDTLDAFSSHRFNKTINPDEALYIQASSIH